VEEQFYKLIWLIDTHYRAMTGTSSNSGRSGPLQSQSH
jgi:hypothetical protein